MATNQTRPVIEIKELTKDYRVGFMIRGAEDIKAPRFRRTTVRVLDHLTLTVEGGEVFGFLGPNGAGKTTTLKLLMGLVHPTSGSAEILGRPFTEVSVKARIGYLPENPYFYDYLTGRELLFYAASLFGMPRSTAAARIDGLLETVGLDQDQSRRHLRKYSKGMLQRIGIAQALVNNPEVLFLDEPMSGLDPIGRREFRDLILSFRSLGKTVFFSSHILADVEAMCDRVAILRKGKLVRAGALSALTSQTRPGLEVVGAATNNDLLEKLVREDSRILSMSVTPGGAHLAIADETLTEAAISLIRQAGGQLVSVSQRRGSLEDLFVE